MAVHAHFMVGAALAITVDQDGLFALFIKHYFSKLNTSWLFLCYHAIILVQAIRINILFNEHKIFAQMGYTPAMTYILLTGIFPDWASITPALLANFLLIFSYQLLVKLGTAPRAKTLIFNIGLSVGVATLCFHPIALLNIVVFFALAILRSFRLQEWFCLLLGVLLPFYFLAASLFLLNQYNHLPFYLPRVKIGLPVDILTPQLGTGIIVIFLCFFAGIFYWQKFNSRLAIQIRKNWSVLLLMAIVAICIPFISHHSFISSSILCLVPFSAFISNAFSYPKRLLFPNLLFWILAAVIVYNNWALIKI